MPENELEQAIKILKQKYERAKHLECVKNPIAYALYQTWKYFDK